MIVRDFAGWRRVVASLRAEETGVPRDLSLSSEIVPVMALNGGEGREWKFDVVRPAGATSALVYLGSPGLGEIWNFRSFAGLRVVGDSAIRMWGLVNLFGQNGWIALVASQVSSIYFGMDIWVPSGMVCSIVISDGVTPTLLSRWVGCITGMGFRSSDLT